MLEIKTNHGAIEISMAGHPLEICADVGIIINQVFSAIFQEDPFAGVAFREGLTTMVNDDKAELFRYNEPQVNTHKTDKEGNENVTE